MPAAIRYGTPNTPQWKSAETDFTKESIARHSDAKQAWAYYLGEHKKPLKPDKSQVDDNMVINLIGLIVDKGVSALFGASEVEVDGGVKFAIVNQPGEPGFVVKTANKVVSAVRDFFGAVKQQIEDPAQDYLDLVWRANQKNILLHDLAMYGGLLGHVFVKLIPNGVTDPETGNQVTRIVNLDPKTVTVYWSASDYSQVLWYRVQYDSGGASYREDTVRALDDKGNPLDYWLIYTYERESATQMRQQGEWKQVGDPVRWGYSFAPIIDWKNMPMPGSYYGRDDVVQNSIKLNDALNFIASNIARILKHHASPKTIATGVAKQDIVPTGVDGLWTIEKETAKVYNLEMQTDLGSSLNFMQFLRRATFDGARELDPTSVQDQLGALTNFALRVLYHDTLQKGGTKRLLYGDGLLRLCRALLALGNLATTVKLSVDWPEPLPNDPVAQAQALAIDVTTGGLSKETYLEKRGYDAEQEAQRREMEQFEAGMNAPSQPDPLEALIGRQAQPVSAVEGQNGGQQSARQPPSV